MAKKDLIIDNRIRIPLDDRFFPQAGKKAAKGKKSGKKKK